MYISKRVMPRQRRSRAAPKVLEEIGAFFILVLTFGTLALFISPSIGLLIWVGGLLITYLIYQAHKASREAYLRSQQTLNQLRAMSPSEFEEFLAWLFRKQGYDVKMTARKGDHGVDLILYKGGRTYGVQAKRFREKQNVGEPMLREFYGSFEDFGIQEGFFVTTSNFTQPARDWAANKAGRLHLISGDDLVRMIQLIRQDQASI